MSLTASMPAKKILIVDDQSYCHEVYKEEFKLLGHYELTFAPTGAEAFTHLTHTKFDLILCELNVPSGNAKWLMQQMQSFHIATPVVILSFQTNQMAIDMASSGAYAFIDKFDFRRLLRNVVMGLFKQPKKNSSKQEFPMLLMPDTRFYPTNRLSKA